jgi:ribosomal-protein-alanine N-acetyltransferase
MKAPETIVTPRLVLRRPVAADAQAIFQRYAGDPAVTRYMSWPTHRGVADALQFVVSSDDEWATRPAGPYLAFTRGEGDSPLLGSTGLYFVRPTVAVTGYVLAVDAWGKGYATESLCAMVDLARRLGVLRVEAICHTEHSASAHVLEKCGFVCEEVLREHTEFPNLTPGQRSDVRSFAWTA